MSLQWHMDYHRQTETDVAAGNWGGSFPIPLFGVPNFQTLGSPYADLDPPSNGGKLALRCQTVAWNIWSGGVCSHLLSLLSAIAKKTLQTVDREEISLLKKLFICSLNMSQNPKVPKQHLVQLWPRLQSLLIFIVINPKANEDWTAECVLPRHTMAQMQLSFNQIKLTGSQWRDLGESPPRLRMYVLTWIPSLGNKHGWEESSSLNLTTCNTIQCRKVLGIQIKRGPSLETLPTRNLLWQHLSSFITSVLMGLVGAVVLLSLKLGLCSQSSTGRKVSSCNLSPLLPH